MDKDPGTAEEEAHSCIRFPVEEDRRDIVASWEALLHAPSGNARSGQ